MALDMKLRSDMTGGTNNTSEETRGTVPPSETGTPSYASPAETFDTREEEIPSAKANTPAEQTKPADTETTELLRSIEKQLKTLNQNVVFLEQEIEECKKPDYRAVFSKIDSARSSIERALSALGTDRTESPDNALLDKVAALEAAVREIAQKQDRNDRQLTQTLRENANFQIQVRQGMQHDIDDFKEQQRGEQFNPVLKAIASIYVEYQGLIENENVSDQFRKNWHSLFEELEDVLSDYDAEISRSEVGTARQTRITKVIEKVPTGDPSRHNTIAVSRKPGVVRGRNVLYPEFVDVFVYDPSIAEEEHGETTEQTDGEASAAEAVGAEHMESAGQTDGEAPTAQTVGAEHMESAGQTDGEAPTAEAAEEECMEPAEQTDGEASTAEAAEEERMETAGQTDTPAAETTKEE